MRSEEFWLLDTDVYDKGQQYQQHCRLPSRESPLVLGEEMLNLL